MTTIPKGGSSTGSYTSTYDAWNRLVKITDNTSGGGSPVTIATYEYDALGRRIEKTVAPGSGDTYDYYHSASWQTLEVRKNDDGSGGDGPLEQYVYDPSYVDAVIMRYHDPDLDGGTPTNGTAVQKQYYLRGPDYSIVALLEDDGDVLERYRYTPYGRRVVMDQHFVADANANGDPFDDESVYDQQRGSQGLPHDEESGFIENRYRILDPMMGIFLQRDPSGNPNGNNAYEYLRSSPSRYLDPSGLEVENDEGEVEGQNEIDRITEALGLITGDNGEPLILDMQRCASLIDCLDGLEIVVYYDPENPTSGHYNSSEKKIYINSANIDMSEGEWVIYVKVWMLLLHELIHAVDCQETFIEDDDVADRMIREARAYWAQRGQDIDPCSCSQACESARLR